MDDDFGTIPIVSSSQSECRQMTVRGEEVVCILDGGTGPLVCPLCSKSFTTFSSFSTHCRDHGFKFGTECGFCGKSGYKIQSIVCHVAKCPVRRGTQVTSVPSGGCPCDACGREFATVRGRSQHERHEHPQLRNTKRIDMARRAVLTASNTETENANGEIVGTRKKKWTAKEEERLAQLEAKYLNDLQINVRIASELKTKSVTEIRNKRKTVAFRGYVRNLNSQKDQRQTSKETATEGRTGMETKEHAPTASGIVDRGVILDLLTKVLPTGSIDATTPTEGYFERTEWWGAVEKVTENLIDALLKLQQRTMGARTDRPKYRRRREKVALRSRNANKRTEYHRIQRRYRLAQKSLAREILDDGETVTCPIPIKEIYDYYSQKLESPNDEVLLDGYVMGTANNERLQTLVSKYEVKGAFMSMDSQSAAGPDGVKVSTVKHYIKKFAGGLAKLFSLWIIKRDVPVCLKGNRSILLFKGGDPKDIKNWRPITIGPAILRAFNKILAKRLTSAIDICPRQKGFMSVPGCDENTFVLEALMDRAKKGKSDLAVALLDVEKAFDSIGHKFLWAALRGLGVDEGFVSLVASLYRDCSTVFEVGGRQSETIWIRNGVKQGDPLSPILFNIALDPLIRRLNSLGLGVRCDEHEIAAEAYADDLGLLSNCDSNMQKLIDESHVFFKGNGLQINVKKSVGFVLKKQGKSYTVNDTEGFKIGGEDLPLAGPGEKVRYLGTFYDPKQGVLKGSCESVNLWLSRIGKAKLKPHQKLQILNVYLMPRLLHPLVQGRPCMKLLKEIDSEIKKAVKIWCHLVPSTSDCLLYTKPRDGGLGVIKLAKVIPRLMIRHDLRLLHSVDPVVRWLARDRRLEVRMEAYAAKAQLPRPDPAAPPDAYEGDWRSQELETWRSQPTQGIGFEAFVDSKTSNAWISDLQGMKSRDWVGALRLRSNTYPTREATGRGVSGSDRSCRWCGAQYESLSHVIGRCPALKKLRIARHNKICDLLAELADERGWFALHECEVTSDSGKTKRPDLIFYQNGVAHIVDVTIRFETSAETLPNAFAEKVEHYSDCLESVRQETGCKQVSVHGFPIGARGGWCGNTTSVLQALGIWGEPVRRLLSRRVLMYTLDMLRAAYRDDYDKQY